MESLARMEQAAHNRIAPFIWDIADDVLRYPVVRGKHRDGVKRGDA